MIYTCPKCGKKMDLSTEVLMNSDYKVVCPQCLCQLQIVGDYAYIPNDELELDTTVEPSHTICCPNCGHEANSNAHFCPNCGTSFDTPVTTAVDVAPEEVTVLPPPLPDQDPLYNDALKFLANCRVITPMMLRDHFGISDERAAHLINKLEKGGAIGPYNNGGPRQILIPHSQLFERRPPEQPASGQQVNVPHRRNGAGWGGCLTWIILFFFLSLLLRTCTG